MGIVESKSDPILITPVIVDLQLSDSRIFHTFIARYVVPMSPDNHAQSRCNIQWAIYYSLSASFLTDASIVGSMIYVFALCNTGFVWFVRYTIFLRAVVFTLVP